jgi:multidrug efflux pump subunit AcrB
MKEISGAIVAITLVMSAVFIPVAFLSGPVGIFYRQFSLTLTFAIVISGINALTFTPALCAIWLQHTHYHDKEKKTWLLKIFDAFNFRYERLEEKYKTIIHKFAPYKKAVLVIVMMAILGAWGLQKALPTGFIPTEDQSMIYVSVTSPVGSTLERTSQTLDKIQLLLQKHEAIESITTLAGFSILTEATGASYGMGMIKLKPWEKKTKRGGTHRRVYPKMQRNSRR